MNNILLKSARLIQQTLIETGFLRGGEFEGYCGYYFCDCSSLISSILKIENNLLYEKINPTRKKIKSVDYFNYAIKKSTFTQNISDLIAGDILCWKKRSIPKNGDSGHMSIVLTSPVQLDQNMFEVRVFDATKNPHSEDSRVQDGVGEGSLYLETNQVGEIIGVRWSNRIKKVKRTPIIAIRL